MILDNLGSHKEQAAPSGPREHISSSPPASDFLGGLTKDEARLAAWDQWRCAAVPAENLASQRQLARSDELTRDVGPRGGGWVHFGL